MQQSQRQLALIRHFQRIRSQTAALCEGLSPEDTVAQSMPDASPVKWHLAHTTWFFENFIAQTQSDHYRPFNEHFHFLFNSYYESEGPRHARPQRGLLTRPTLHEVEDYRAHVNSAMLRLFEQSLSDDVLDLVEIGLHHEMQHQELLMTDLLHLFSRNPLLPAVQAITEQVNQNKESPARDFGYASFAGGLVEAGADAERTLTETDSAFYYDCEGPRHKVWLEPYELAQRPVTNREWILFMEDGGYEQPLLWLSDGWSERQRNEWQAPLYWQQHRGQWHQFGLNGLQPLALEAPVCHISYYEADAFARWAGGRLPSEYEWEQGVANGAVLSHKPNFLETRQWQPNADYAQADANGMTKCFGDVWEWTQSPYIAYPGFRATQGALGEYNGKFMANQWVLRGGSCVTPQLQMRTTYRNFFYPHQRWQFMGMRLAKSPHAND